MSRTPMWVFALGLVCVAPASAAAPECHDRRAVGQAEQAQPPQQAPPASPTRDQKGRWMWWRVPESKAELGISDQQAAEIDQIFQATVPALRAAKEDLDKLDAEVAQVIKPANADVSAVQQLVSRAEHARAKLTITRTVMFYRMHRVLSSEQRAKLDAMFERWEAQRRKNTDTRR